MMPTAASAKTVREKISTLSKVLMVGMGGATGAGREAGAGCRVCGGAMEGAAGAAAEMRGAGAWATGAAALGGAWIPEGPPGGSVGSLMVGAADGLGGKLMRTVSFLG